MNTNPVIINADGIIEAWRNAATLLVEHGDRFNLAVHIAKPAALNEGEVAHYCHRRVKPKIRQSVYDVANTIFPATTPRHSSDLDQFFAYYGQVYARGQRRSPQAWGTYFLRLISFGASKENQLRKIIDAQVGWKSRPRAAFVVHLSSAELDNPRPLGAPCWQYAQFLRTNDDTLSMTAVYRSHDYFQKALGNFVGLARLLSFVCQRCKMNPGTLTCLSTYASLQSENRRTQELLNIQ